MQSCMELLLNCVVVNVAGLCIKEETHDSRLPLLQELELNLVLYLDLQGTYILDNCTSYSRIPCI